MTIKAIETRYAGHRFRSRLEARWAVFFDHLDIRWEYEPQGFNIDGRPYLPDFLLPDCGTWIEVKGHSKELDLNLIHRASLELPQKLGHGEMGPTMMVLGPIPKPQPAGWDYGWLAVSPYEKGGSRTDCCGFGMYYKNSRPWWMPCGNYADGSIPHKDSVSPCLTEEGDSSISAYAAARSARFEHGEVGAQ